MTMMQTNRPTFLKKEEAIDTLSSVCAPIQEEQSKTGEYFKGL